MKTGSTNLPAQIAVILGLILFCGLADFGLPLILHQLPELEQFHDLPWELLLGRAVLDCLLLIAMAQVSFELGWRAARFFWSVVIAFTATVLIVANIVPLLIGQTAPGLARGLGLASAWLVAAVAVLWLSSSRTRAAAFWRPVDALLRVRGFATKLAAIAVPARLALLAYSFGPQMLFSQTPTRLLHATAPAEFASLVNPFFDPEYCVVLDEIGPNPQDVVAIVQAAVQNRSREWGLTLVARLPVKIRETADEEMANELAEQLRVAGANASVHHALDWFARLVAEDRETPIGKPSQVLDDEFLRTGDDAIAAFRAAVRTSGPDKINRELAKRAFLAFTTAEGRALYQTNCRPCHGTKGSGDGPQAAGFLLRPANFRDTQSLAALTPGEVLWRIEEGAAGLPVEATPWHSSMPAWKHELDREMIWKIILGEFSTANAKPRSGQAPDHTHRQPVVAAAGSGLNQPPEKSWLEWQVPSKPAAERMRDAEFLKRGKYIYYYRCMPCHGVMGEGDGPAAASMWPRPRDFTTENFANETLQPKFKFRTTKQGWLPTDEDLFRTISRGLTGTDMEGWADVLSADEIWQVIAHLKTLSPAWNDPEHIARNPNDPVVVKEYTEFERSSPVIDYAALQPPAVTPRLIQEGKEVFLRFRCFECHGYEARGDGPALGQHYDDWGYRLWPQNLAAPFNFKAGHAIKDIYRTFANSLDGTVMPVYSAVILDKDDPKNGEHMQWALAAFVNDQVQMPSRANQPANIIVKQLPGSIPLDPLDPVWDRMRTTVVPLSGQVLAAPRWPAPSVHQVSIRAAYTPESFGIWLRWDDRRPNILHQEPPPDFDSMDEHSLGPRTYSTPALKKKSPVVFEARDQLEIQMPERIDPWHPYLKTVERPPLLYGERESPAILWRWQADNQGLAVTKITEKVAGAQAERIVCKSDAAAAPASAMRLFRTQGLDLEPEELPIRTESRSTAHWANGAWTLVLSNPRPWPDELIQSGQKFPIAIHIWDGLAGESESRMAVSSWIDLAFPHPRPLWHHVLAVVLGTFFLAAELVMASWYRRQFLTES